MNRNAMATKGRKIRDLSQKVLKSITWLGDYATYYGDRMPDCKYVLLPYKTTRIGLYNTYTADMTAEGCTAVSRSSFQSIWKVFFTQLKIKQINSFSKCDICASLERRLEFHRSPADRAILLKQRQEHNQRQMMERKYYYSKRDASRQNPSSFLSLIIDGMDQSKSNLPHFVGRRAKAINPADLLKTHIAGVINHGSRSFSTYLDFGQYPHDPNLTINILLKVLLKIADANEKLPQILYLQADNCWRENKNKYVLGFCELLVHERIFNEVHLSFLFVGHTHEDVDARFSKIAERLRKNDAETLEDLRSLLPDVTDLNNMLDVKTFLEPCLRQFAKHTSQHHYKFTLVDGKATCMYKTHQNSVWQTFTDESVFSYYPRRKPGVLLQDFTRIDSDKVKKQVEHIRYLFSSEQKLKCWENYFNSLINKKRSVPSRWIKDLPKQRQTQEPIPAQLDLPPAIEQRLVKETTDTQIKVRPIRQVTKTKKKIVGKKNTLRGATETTRKRRPVYLHFRCKSVLILYNTDEKRHIWFLILWCFLANAVLCIFMALFYIFITFLQMLDGLVLLLQFIESVWLQIIITHIGRNRVYTDIQSVLPVLYSHQV